ncbi:hypothetical protein MNBD_GAMMA17-508 [hydrothermal vent metagenome]|uniref:Uncharacterized protein n=1 Tax=hydrothermal vent metagenome TaxID=652676 RepID=A0A3B1A410_9ZZZZ
MRCINISLIGLTQQDQAILAVAINLVDVSGVTLAILPDGVLSGELILINSDTDAGSDYLKQENTSQVKIVLAEKFMSTTIGTRLLERPVRIHDLVNAFNTSCERFKSSTEKNIKIGSHVPTKNHAPAPAPAQANNTPFLLHEFINVCKKNGLVKLECPPYSPLYINGIARSVATRATLPEIHIIAREKETRPQVTMLSAADEYEQASKNEVNIYPINTVIWHTALVGAEGVILPDHSHDTPVKLKSMPRFPREYMRKHPEYLKMSALLTRESMTANQLQQATQLDIKVVTDFYNLVFALGLSAIDEKVNTTMLYQKKKMKNSSLLARLAKKLSAAG